MEYLTSKVFLGQDSSFSWSSDSALKAAKSLPCLYSNNSIERPENTPDTPVEGLCALLSPYHRKAAHALSENVSSLVNSVGIERLGFLTLTFPDNVTDHKEAYDRFRSFNTNYLSSHPDFGSWLLVKERQKRGAWHYHMLIDCGADVRTGVDWDSIEKGSYSSASSHLRGLWADLRENLPKYGFGRSELLPIRENAEAMSRYVGKYISKHIDARSSSDKGVRLVSYSRNWSRSNANFQWHTPNSQLWRANLRAFAEFFGCWSLAGLKERFGSRWAYHLADSIIHGNWPERLALKKELEALRPAAGSSAAAFGGGGDGREAFGSLISAASCLTACYFAEVPFKGLLLSGFS